LLEDLPKRRQLLRAENSFDALVGAIPDRSHLLRSPSRTAAAFSACAVGRRTASASTTTTTAPASSTAHSATSSTTAAASTASSLTTGVLPKVLHLHRLIGQDRADLGLLRGIELQRLSQSCHLLVDHLARIHSRPVGRTLLLRFLALRGGRERDTSHDGRANCRG
jgi:hypothetical protein